MEEVEKGSVYHDKHCRKSSRENKIGIFSMLIGLNFLGLAAFWLKAMDIDSPPSEMRNTIIFFVLAIVFLSLMKFGIRPYVKKRKQFAESFFSHLKKIYFVEREYVLVQKDDNYGLLDTEYISLMPCIYSKLDFKKIDRYIVVEKDGKEGVCNAFGKNIIPTEYDEIVEYDIMKRCFICLKGDKVERRDKRGRILSDLLQ
ncbi:TDT family transporter [Sediminitomix flava]|uniref:Uncharacterized protein n=1 Tax=Sediminitomix flava TaxID=379075 RepID=A0A315ZCT9_SEDFL|nr:hypothetical protein [Sediminitomix flava]PWJ43102.1 hypothetical protein BC781_102650 [Sediminitomix flava]